MSLARTRHDLLTKASVPEHGKAETSYPTPNKGDMVVIERIPLGPKRYRPLPYASPHPDWDNNGLFLVWQGKVRAENNQISAVRVYANDLPTNENWYNASVKYSGEVITFPVYVRTYIELRQNYFPAAQATPLTNVIRLRVTAQGTYTPATVPTATISGGGGSGATCRVIMNPAKTKVIALELTAQGSGFTSNPSVVFSSGAATATAEIQPTTMKLVQEQTTKLDSEDKQLASLFIKVHRVYESLPGPKLVTDVYDDNDRGPVQRTAQFVLSSDVTGAGIGSEAATYVYTGTYPARVVTKTWFEPRGDSAIVLTKYVETWTEVTKNDKFVETNFGGAIGQRTSRTDPPGTVTVESGYLVISSKQTQKNPGEQETVTEKFDPSSAVPVLELVIGGGGYGPTAPSVTLTGGTGSGGTAHSILGFPVIRVAVTAGGSNYTTPPSVHFINAIGGGGLAIAVLGFGVASAHISNGGTEYNTVTGVPAVTFSSPPTGSAATGTAVVGYGVYFATVTDPGGRATGTLQGTATNIANNDTVTIGTKVYTFKNALTPTEGEVLRGASTDASLLNLISAINHTGVPNVDYKCAAANTQVTAATSVSSHAFAVTAISPGIGGNSIATTESSTQLSWGAATLLGGFSYTEVPRVVLHGGGGTGALAYVIMGSPIDSIAITNHGTGFSAGNAPTLSVVFGVGDGLTTTVALGFPIASITASVIGSGYVQGTTTVTIGAPEPGGVQATADPIVTINGPVDNTVTIDSGGSGYTSAPTPDFSAGSGTGAAGTAVLGYEVASVTLDTAGTGYTSFPSFSISGGGGTGATISVRMALESITAIVSGGTAYAVNDILDVVGGTHTTVAQIRVTAVSSGVITAVSVETAGLYSTLTANPHSVTGGAGGTTTDTLAYVSSGDANGLFYWIGSNFGGTWTNPHTAGRVTFSKSVTPFSTDPLSALCDRGISYVSNDNVNGDWIGVDIGTGRTLVIDEYIMQNGSQSPYDNAPANWNLEGSNNVAAPYAVSDFNAATWSSIDVRTGDTTIGQSLGAWGHFTANQSNTTPYRFFRVKTTGLNQTGTLYFLQVGEIEFYGSFFRPIPASGATFTLKWLVAQVNLTANGNGYITAPTIAFSGGGAGTQATAHSTLDSTGSVKSVTVTAGGSGYTADFTVTFTSGGGSGASATAHVTSGAVTGYTITEPGTGYVDTPSVTINSPGGTSAVGTAVKATTGGGVWRITVTNGGVWELPAPTLVLTGGDGTGATATASLDLDTLFVHRVHVTLPGHGYTSPPTPDFSYADGSVPVGLTATTTLLSTGGEVVGITITSPGFGYISEPTITFSYGSASADATLGSLGKVVAVNVLAGGLYRTTPDVQFVSVDGVLAAGTATIDTTNGSVVALVLDTPGTYTVAPSVVFGGTPTVTATGIYHLGTDEWPANPSFDTDDVTGIVINQIEKVVQTGTPYPGRSGYRGPFISQKVYDRWKTYQVTKSVDLSTLPAPEAWYSTYPFYRPPVLISLEAYWSDTVSKAADATKDSARDTGSVSVSVASGSSGGLLAKAYPAFRGRANSIVCRDYFYGQVPSKMWNASDILSSDGTNVANLDTVTIGSKVYTFKDTITTEGDVRRGADAIASVLNLSRAINHTGTPGTDYNCAASHPSVVAEVLSGGLALLVNAVLAGTYGYSISVAEASAHLSWGTGTLAGGLIPIKITGASGSVVLIQTSSSTFRSRRNGDTGSTTLTQFGAASFEAGRIGDTFQKQVHALDIDNHLIGNYDVIAPDHRSPPVSAYGQAGENQLTIVAAGTPSEMQIRLPRSNPTPEYLYPGRLILMEAEPSEWKFGIWKLERIYVIVPPLIA